ncbi:hypothetical protein BDV93DRAFT_507426 [Ceratobasidium sp. AG-I]|nr:hypothetical protein BDV93DRAFT_507426 [Ceratobasidium sp. AG-I]
MRSIALLCFLLLALLAVLPSAQADPEPETDPAARVADIPTTGEIVYLAHNEGLPKQSSPPGISLAKTTLERLGCPTGTGSCPNDPGVCCPAGGRDVARRDGTAAKEEVAASLAITAFVTLREKFAAARTERSASSNK